jgi:hypothetical protein
MIDHVMRSRDGMKIHIVELFDPLGIEYCTFWFYSVVKKARYLFITRDLSILLVFSGALLPRGSESWDPLRALCSSRDLAVTCSAARCCCTCIPLLPQAAGLYAVITTAC